MVPGDMYEWSRVIFAKKSKFHDEGGPDTVVSPKVKVGVDGHAAILAEHHCMSMGSLMKKKNRFYNSNIKTVCHDC